MKTTIPLIAAICCGLSSIGSAFTLDFTRNVFQNTADGPIFVDVPDYGLVRFDSDDTLVVDSRFENDSDGDTTSPSLNFATGDSVQITFLAADPINVTFAFVGRNVGENFDLGLVTSPNVFSLALNDPAANPLESGAGLFEIGFATQSVPEPSTSLLGLIGGTLLVLRRRR